MRSVPSALTPFVRSDVQGAVLAEVLLHPEVEVSVSDLARAVDAPVPTVSREVARLVEARVVISRMQGRNRLVRANADHPLFGPMSEIIAATYGPVPVLRALLAEVPGLEAAYLYGSWAARRHGARGGPPRDVDVLVVGRVDVSDLVDVEERARALIGLEVNIHRTTAQAWAEPETNTFLTTVRSRPLITLIGDDLAPAPNE